MVWDTARWLKYPGLTQWMDAQARDKGGVGLSARAPRVSAISALDLEGWDKDMTPMGQGQALSAAAGPPLLRVWPASGEVEEGGGDQRGRGGLGWPASASSRIIPKRDPRAARLSLDRERACTAQDWCSLAGGLCHRGECSFERRRPGLRHRARAVIGVVVAVYYRVVPMCSIRSHRRVSNATGIYPRMSTLAFKRSRSKCAFRERICGCAGRPAEYCRRHRDSLFARSMSLTSPFGQINTRWPLLAKRSSVAA